MSRKPNVRPMSGARTMKIRVLVHPDAMIPLQPALAIAAPA
jgi:hypothetical protein